LNHGIIYSQTDMMKSVYDIRGCELIKDLFIVWHQLTKGYKEYGLDAQLPL